MKTHWKKFHNPDYIGAYALEPGQEIILTIKSAGMEQVIGSSGKKEDCMVIHFSERNVKPMICNVTNAKTITKVVGSPYVEDWTGNKIQLYAAKVNAFGEEVEALRVRPKAPKGEAPKPELTPEHSKWVEVVDKIGKGTPIETVEQYFTISNENKELLFEEASAIFGGE
jgi:hypothetical protein